MILGWFRAGHPRTTLTLPGADGPEDLEFIIDTGFEGDLAVPIDIVHRLDLRSSGFRRWALADGSVLNCPFCHIHLHWEDIERLTEVLVLEGQPLIGTTLLEGYLLQIEVMEGGEASIEPL